MQIWSRSEVKRLEHDVNIWLREYHHIQELENYQGDTLSSPSLPRSRNVQRYIRSSKRVHQSVMSVDSPNHNESFFKPQSPSSSSTSDDDENESVPHLKGNASHLASNSLLYMTCILNHVF
jgi:hypothetical protein